MNSNLFFLLIDDDNLANALSAKLIEKVFVNANINIVNKSDATIKLLKEQKYADPDLIFLDINLGNENGWNLLEDINKIFTERSNTLPKVIILTSSIFEEDRLRTKKYSNVIKYISKPMSVTELKEISNEYFTPA
jgi:response regulator RpfG family c-di-GMP phosphodiesterase